MSKPHPARAARHSWVAGAAAALLLGACYVPIAGAPLPEPAEEDRAAAAIEDFTVLLDAARRNAGCPSLTWDRKAAALARAHSTDMRRRRYFAHESPDGIDPFERMAAAGIPFSVAGENIAQGYRTGEELFRQWRDSPGHRRNMLDCRYTRHGLGNADDYWTHLLFAP